MAVDGETTESAIDFTFWGSKITANGDCSHEIKRRLLLGRKPMINLDSVLKSRDITLLTKVHRVKTMVFPIVMYECDSQNINKAEQQRMDFRTVVLEKTLGSPRTARRSNQSILKEINPKYQWKNWCLSSNTLATWWEEQSHWKRPWC